MNTPRFSLFRRPPGPGRRSSGSARRSRRGTVLIFVIALLVLMALIGTAYISTTREDTYSSRTNALNSQVDLLLEGGKNIAVGRIVDSLFGNTASGRQYRPASSTSPNVYLNYTSPTDTTFLASRVPAAGPVWPFITDPLVGTQFEDPTGSAWSPAARTTAPNYVIGVDATNTYSTLAGRVAADTDGDGIADAGLIRIPMQNLDGLTWYYGFRIIDNNSAVNASTAWKWNDDYTAEPNQVPGNFFPTNVDLTSLLNTGNTTEINALNQFRSNTTTPTPTFSATPVDDTLPNGANRSDFSFISPYDAMWMQLGRRLGNPGYNVPGTKYQALSWSDAIALAAHFCLVPSGSTSTVAQALNQSIIGPNAPFAAANFNTPVTGWYPSLFDYTSGTYMPAKPLLTARNAVSDAIPNHFVCKEAWTTGTTYAFGDWVTYSNHSYVCIQPHAAGAGNQPNPAGGSLYWEPMPWTSVPVKTSINTGTFGQLWLAFWNVMYDAPSASPIFRNPIRSAVGGPALTHDQVVKLRAALAAVNAIDLRDGDDDVTSRKITLDAGPAIAYDVMVYGAEKQPYLTEMFLHVDTDATKTYMAIELYNPYPTAITLNNWQLATLDRAASPMTPTAMTPAATLTITIPAKSFVVLESAQAARPVDLDADFTARAITPAAEVPGLTAAIGKEIVLLRPRRADGTISSSADVTNPYNEANLSDLVPVDQIDTTGLETPPAVGTANRFFYRRGSDTGAAPSLAWHWVYPGPWDVTATPHQTGIIPDPGNATGTPTLVGHLGAADTAGGIGGNNDATYATLPLQIANVDTAGPNKATAATGNKFPFGGFARNGDILQVPFIGAYRIQTAGAAAGPVIEMNSVAMDSVFADDQDATDDPQIGDGAATAMREQLGRFCPLTDVTPANTTYDWASDLLDYLTVDAPSNDYLPNVDPDRTTVPLKYPGAEPQPVANDNAAVSNALTTNAGHATEDTVGVEGLININTAPARVLATLPMLTDKTANANLATAIVADRQANGPFKSPFDLYRVPAFKTANDGLLASEPNDAEGDLSPFDTTATDLDQVRYDFEERYLLLNRISNLITTRSDSFTVYVVVEGWENAGTANAKRIVQRRAAYIVDRTSVTPISKDPRTVYVPNN